MNLKPVTFVNSRYPRYQDNKFQQILLLKALKITSDPKELRVMIGAKKVSDVYRTMDKMLMRKDFHRALETSGVSFDYIVQGLKLEADTAEKAADRIKVYQTLLKALGMDKYDDPVDSGTAWEESLLEKLEAEKTEKLALTSGDEYIVNRPEVPESAKKRQEEEREIARSIYE